jgi:hypothetical protein
MAIHVVYIERDGAFFHSAHYIATQEMQLNNVGKNRYLTLIIHTDTGGCLLHVDS